MSAPVLRKLPRVTRATNEQTETTLLDLVTAVADSSNSDEEVLATVSSLLRSGRVKLVGNFCGETLGEERD